MVSNTPSTNFSQPETLHELVAQSEPDTPPACPDTSKLVRSTAELDEAIRHQRMRGIMDSWPISTCKGKSQYLDEQFELTDLLWDCKVAIGESSTQSPFTYLQEPSRNGLGYLGYVKVSREEASKYFDAMLSDINERLIHISRSINSPFGSATPKDDLNKQLVVVSEIMAEIIKLQSRLKQGEDIIFGRYRIKSDPSPVLSTMRNVIPENVVVPSAVTSALSESPTRSEPPRSTDSSPFRNINLGNVEDFKPNVNTQLLSTQHPVLVPTGPRLQRHTQYQVNRVLIPDPAINPALLQSYASTHRSPSKVSSNIMGSTLLDQTSVTPRTPAVELKSTEKHHMPQKPVTILKRPSSSDNGAQSQTQLQSSDIPAAKKSKDKPVPKKMTASSFWNANTNGNSGAVYPSIGKSTPKSVSTNPFTPSSITTNPFTSRSVATKPFTSNTTSTDPYPNAGLPPKPAPHVPKDPYSNASLPPKPKWK
jgi:hypothetical protein